MKLAGCGQPFYLKGRGLTICGYAYSPNKHFFCKKCIYEYSLKRKKEQIDEKLSKEKHEKIKNTRPQMEIIPPNYKELTELILAFAELYKHSENKKIVDLIIVKQLKPLGVIVDNIDLQNQREDV